MAKKVRKKRKPHSKVDVVKEKAAAYGIKVVDPKRKSFTPAEAGEVLGVTGEAIKQWIYKRQLPAIRQSNRRWRVSADDLERFIAKRQQTESRKIFIVGKDLSAMRQRTKEMQELGHEIFICESKADALLKASSNYPSMFVVEMSGFKDGWSLIEKIRSMGSQRVAHIVMLTDKDLGEKEIEEAMKLRIQACLSRKVNKATFVEEVGKILKHSM